MKCIASLYSCELLNTYADDQGLILKPIMEKHHRILFSYSDIQAIFACRFNMNHGKIRKKPGNIIEKLANFIPRFVKTLNDRRKSLIYWYVHIVNIFLRFVKK